MSDRFEEFKYNQLKVDDTNQFQIEEGTQDINTNQVNKISQKFTQMTQQENQKNQKFNSSSQQTNKQTQTPSQLNILQQKQLQITCHQNNENNSNSSEQVITKLQQKIAQLQKTNMTLTKKINENQKKSLQKYKTITKENVQLMNDIQKVEYEKDKLRNQVDSLQKQITLIKQSSIGNINEGANLDIKNIRQSAIENQSSSILKGTNLIYSTVMQKIKELEQQKLVKNLIQSQINIQVPDTMQFTIPQQEQQCQSKQSRSKQCSQCLIKQIKMRELTKQMNKAESYKYKFNERQLQNKKLQNIKNQLFDRIKSNNVVVSELNKSKEQLQKQIKQKNIQISLLKSNLESTKCTLESTKRTLESIKSNLESTKNELDCNSQQNKQYSQLIGEIQQQGEVLTRLKTQNLQLKQKLLSVEPVKQMNKIQQSDRIQLQLLNQQFKNQNLLLTHINHDLQKQFKALMSENTKIKQQNKIYIEQIQKCLQQKMLLSSKIQELSKQNKGLVQKTNQNQIQIKQLLQRIKSQQKQQSAKQIKHFQNIIKSNVQQNHLLQKQFDQLKIQSDQLKKNIIQLKNRYNDQIKQFKEINQTLQNKIIDQLNTTKQQLTKTNDQLNITINQLNNIKSSHSSQINNFKEQILHIQKQILKYKHPKTLKQKINSFKQLFSQPQSLSQQDNYYCNSYHQSSSSIKKYKQKIFLINWIEQYLNQIVRNNQHQLTNFKEL